MAPDEAEIPRFVTGPGFRRRIGSAAFNAFTFGPYDRISKPGPDAG